MNDFRFKPVALTRFVSFPCRGELEIDNKAGIAFVIV